MFKKYKNIEELREAIIWVEKNGADITRYSFTNTWSLGINKKSKNGKVIIKVEDSNLVKAVNKAKRAMEEIEK